MQKKVLRTQVRGLIGSGLLTAYRTHLFDEVSNMCWRAGDRLPGLSQHHHRRWSSHPCNVGHAHKSQDRSNAAATFNNTGTSPMLAVHMYPFVSAMACQPTQPGQSNEASTLDALDMPPAWVA